MGVGRIALFGLAAVGALALGIGAAEVQQRYGDRIVAMFGGPTYDDPAVAVCEFTKLRGREPNPSEYTRKSAIVDGLSVTIVHTKSPLNTRPQEDEYSCLFEADDDGAFKLARNFQQGTQECSERIRVMRSELSPETTRERRDEILAYAESCQETIDREFAEAARTLLDEDMILSAVGIYPIPADQTALRQ